MMPLARLDPDVKSLGKLDNHEQEPWKAPLPEFIERLHAPEALRQAPSGRCVSTEERARMEEDRKARKREMRRQGAGDDVHG